VFAHRSEDSITTAAVCEGVTPARVLRTVVERSASPRPPPSGHDGGRFAMEDHDTWIRGDGGRVLLLGGGFWGGYHRAGSARRAPPRWCRCWAPSDSLAWRPKRTISGRTDQERVMRAQQDPGTLQVLNASRFSAPAWSPGTGQRRAGSAPPGPGAPAPRQGFTSVPTRVQTQSRGQSSTAGRWRSAGRTRFALVGWCGGYGGRIRGLGATAASTHSVRPGGRTGEKAEKDGLYERGNRHGSITSMERARQ